MKQTIIGAAGRMGRTIARLASAADDIELVGAVDGPSSPHLGRDLGEIAGAGHCGVEISADAASALLGADVAVDFTVAPAFSGMLRAATRAGVAVVSGTTGLSAADERLIDKAAGEIAVLWAPNMSVGVQLLTRLVKEAVGALGDYDVEIVETHHNQKADAPSGTAKLLMRAAQAARSELAPVHGREGEPGARKSSEIGMHALRGGTVVGDHSVHLIGEFDRIEITHQAMSRDLFAAGALRAARYLATQQPGRYTLADILDS